MNVKKIIILIIMVIVAAAGMYAYRQYSRTNESLANQRSDFSLAADELIREFSGNDSLANLKYLGRIITVQGAIRDVSPENRTIILGDPGSLSSVRCSMDSMAMSQAPALKQGMQVTIKGNCTGFNKDEMLGSDVILNRCVIYKQQEP